MRVGVGGGDVGRDVGRELLILQGVRDPHTLSTIHWPTAQPAS